ncbi:MAG: nucleoside 2-deoxyribosyltransferase [Candidatus Lernaella stagnicola]|nr:nucleoside 2-deoxyribosyltransferase [Candidatus Lernaella stagnicola]
MWKKYDFFIAGVIQGSIAEKQVHAQDYRDEIKKVLAEKAPERSVFCPVEEHCNSVEYSDEEAREVFFGHLDILRQARVMIAYLPVASMGTAIEMEVCRAEGIPIIAVSPMAHNWVIRLYSQAVVPDIAALAAWLTPERLAELNI